MLIILNNIGQNVSRAVVAPQTSLPASPVCVHSLAVIGQKEKWTLLWRFVCFVCVFAGQRERQRDVPMHISLSYRVKFNVPVAILSNFWAVQTVRVQLMYVFYQAASKLDRRRHAKRCKSRANVRDTFSYPCRLTSQAGRCNRA